MHKAVEIPLDVDVRPLLQALQERGIRVMVSEEGGQQCLWVPIAEDVQLVQHAWRLFQSGDWQSMEVSPRSWRQPVPVQSSIPLQHYPLTLAVLLLTGAVFVMTWLLQDVRWLSLLTFEPLRVQGGQVTGLHGFMAGWQAGEYWRAVTPVFLHFGFLHLVFNSLWWWELGRRIEVRRGSVYLGLLALVTAIPSNAAQYLAGRWFNDPGVFGGLSGVIYGLIGYIAVWNAMRPAYRYHVPRGLVGVMIGFLLVCMTGVMEWVGLGRIANAAHVGGLLAGAVWGVLAAIVDRQRRI